MANKHKGLKAFELRNTIPVQTSSVEVKSGIFLPVKIINTSKSLKEFLKGNKFELLAYDSEFAEIFIRGRLLSQTHKDILDIILTTAEKNESGKYISTVTLRQINRMLGSSSGNVDFLKKKIQELADVSIIYRIKKDVFKILTEDIKKNCGDNVEVFREYHFHILNYATTPETGKYAFILDDLYLNIIHKFHTSLDYRKKMPEILKIKDLFIKAIVRYCLVQKYVNIKFENLLKKIRYPIDEVTRQQKSLLRRKLKNHAKILEDNFGITYNSDTEIIKYNVNPDTGLVKYTSDMDTKVDILRNSTNLLKKKKEKK